MPEYIPPGVYIEEVDSGPRPIEGVSTSVAGIVGLTERGPAEIRPISSFREFTKVYGNHLGADKSFLSYAVQGFFENGGKKCYIGRIVGSGPCALNVQLKDYAGNSKCGLQGLVAIDEVSLLVAPDQVHPRVDFREALTNLLIQSCENSKDRFAILSTEQDFKITSNKLPDSTSYAALYHPWIRTGDSSAKQEFLIPPSGHVAGVYARTDQERGVHKAPANELVIGAKSLQYAVSKTDQNILNRKGVNCIREFTGRGIRIWGARTLNEETEFKYVNIRRLFIFLEQSIDKGTQWAVFEPNDESTWAKVRAVINDFLFKMWRSGVFAGKTPKEAFYIRCDRSTMSQNDLEEGRLVCEIGVAPVIPAEFVVVRISHLMAQT